MEPQSPEFATAVALQKAGQLPEAERLYRHLLNHVSQAAQAHSALGVLLTDQGRFAEARQHYQRVAEQNSDDFLAHRLLADKAADAGDLETAARHHRNAADCRPDDLLSQVRADIVAPVVYKSNAAINAFRARLMECLEGHRRPGLRFDIDELVASGCKPPIVLAYQGRDDRPIKELFASIFVDRLAADLPRANTGKPHVGFVVTEGNEGVFLRGMAGVIQHLDMRRLQVTIVCAAGAEGRFRAAIGREIGYLRLAERFTSALEAIRAARFDLLYYWEIGTDCTNYFLPLFRLAPIQCTSWGWPVTSGITEVDYFLSSELLEPTDADAHYTERLVRLKHLPNYYAMPDTPGLVIDRRNSEFDERQHIYFCGQNARKLHPDFDGLMGRILRCDPRGIIVLVEASKLAVTAALKQRFEKMLPDCVDRIRWAPRMNQATYTAMMAAADCVLDTPHYSGGANTTYDAIAVGAAIVTLPGEFHRGRYTAAAYRAMGVTDCVATSAQDYGEIALRIAADRDFRRTMRGKIVETRGVLFENLAAVRELEEFFLQAIEQVR